jgi:nicotinate-nucleotide adenylyltransferase
MSSRIGLFGGTFDPPHNAHLALARAAVSQLRLDEVRWIPAGAPWQKTRNITAPVHRAEMVDLSIAGEPRFVLDRCEIQRSGPSFTIDTVRQLQAEQPGATWVLLLGDDQYSSLHTWRGWQDLVRLVELAVANRPGEPLLVHGDLSRVPHRTVNIPMMDVSSTEIRRRVYAGEPITDLVPPDVARYIARHRLYKDAAAH